jgi:acylphosphatase
MDRGRAVLDVASPIAFHHPAILALDGGGLATENGGVSDVRCRVIVSGRVQGVYYRHTCRAVARELGVKGWVRNRSDGTVEVVAEGSRAAVGDLIAWCREGPPSADIRGLEITDETPVGERDFRVV